jgi:hypothetical protein
MKTIGLLFTGTILFGTNFKGAESSSLDFFERPDEHKLTMRDFFERPDERKLSMRYLEERNLSMRYIRDRNLSMRYLVEGRHLSMRYLVVVDESDVWGRSLTDSEKEKIAPIVEEHNGSLRGNRKLSMRYLQKQKGGKAARRLRVTGK